MPVTTGKLGIVRLSGEELTTLRTQCFVRDRFSQLIDVVAVVGIVLACGEEIEMANKSKGRMKFNCQKRERLGTRC
jgi:hypothetical protein